MQDLDLRKWRRMVGYVPQENVLLHDSVLNNVTLGDPELVEAARDELEGYDLACWCPLDEPCHADVWLEILKSDEGN